MSDATSPEYRRCPNCGTYHAPDLTNSELCSPACSVAYERCAICGKFFEKGRGVSDGVCSAECSRTYAPAEKDTFILTEETV